MLIKLMDIFNTSYTAHPLLVVLPTPTKHEDHADDSDIQLKNDVIPGAPAPPPKVPVPPLNRREEEANAVPKDSHEHAKLIATADNKFDTALGGTRLIMVTVNHTTNTYNADVLKTVTDAKLKGSKFTVLSTDHFPEQSLRERNMVSKEYKKPLRDLVFDLSYPILFETLQNINEKNFVVIDNTVQVKKYFLDALVSLAPKIPADWDVLFLDCPDECGVAKVDKMGLTPVDAEVCGVALCVCVSLSLSLSPSLWSELCWSDMLFCSSFCSHLR
jgi:hypothetical protein